MKVAKQGLYKASNLEFIRDDLEAFIARVCYDGFKYWI
jgi:hypothetical protein